MQGVAHAAAAAVSLGKVGHEVDGLVVERKSLVALRGGLVDTAQEQHGVAVERIERAQLLEQAGGFLQSVFLPLCS